jgi:hypothetical protein
MGYTTSYELCWNPSLGHWDVTERRILSPGVLRRPISDFLITTRSLRSWHRTRTGRLGRTITPYLPMNLCHSRVVKSRCVSILLILIGLLGFWKAFFNDQTGVHDPPGPAVPAGTRPLIFPSIPKQKGIPSACRGYIFVGTDRRRRGVRLIFQKNFNVQAAAEWGPSREVESYERNGLRNGWLRWRQLFSLSPLGS